MKVINVAEYSEFPGPRFKLLGPFSGEDFRETVLIPTISSYKSDITINFDDTMGYGSSFLEEAFGGLIRQGVAPEIVLAIIENIISEQDPSLIDEVRSYVQEAIIDLKSK